jgi:AcrR family transcriptional regulator
MPGVKQRRTQEERSRDMIQRLMEATIDCLQQYGYRDTTIARVGAHAGVSTGAMIHHFPTKSDLFAAAHDYAYEKVFARYRKIGEQHADLRARWQALVECFSDRDRYSIAEMELTMASRSDEGLNQRLETTSDMRTDRMRQLMQQLFADSVDPAPHTLVQLTMLLVQALAMVRSSPKASTWRQENLDRWMQIIEPMLLTPRGNSALPRGKSAPGTGRKRA